MDPEVDPDDRLCRFGCNSVEDGQHILLECPKFDTQREKLVLGLEKLQVEPNFDNLLGTNQNLNSHTQFKILKLVSAFVTHAHLFTIL